MLLAALILAAAAPPAQIPAGEISPEVAAVARKHGTSLPPEAVGELERLAAGGDRSAAGLLGEYLMYKGRAPGSDWTRACDYSEQAGQFTSALHNLANCHFYGNGRPRDLPRARLLYGQAMELGMAKSACALGNMLISGEGGDKEVARGLDLCRRAADAGDPDAQTDYGGYLLTDRHMPRDAVLARRYLTPAAEKKQANAAFLLGQIYWFGDGIEKNPAEAARWWKVAHEGGRPDAAFHLAREAIERMSAAREAKKPIPDAALDDAEHWLKIAAERDPDMEKRAHAAEQLANIAGLREVRRRNEAGGPN